ncbi:hypothetical protein TrVGV298_007300 [Trichoderma virens]|nr:hypothetical protein TrVGV298_007300 [Trichoderma virens]
MRAQQMQKTIAFISRMINYITLWSESKITINQTKAKGPFQKKAEDFFTPPLNLEVAIQDKNRMSTEDINDALFKKH